MNHKIVIIYIRKLDYYFSFRKNERKKEKMTKQLDPVEFERCVYVTNE